MGYFVLSVPDNPLDHVCSLSVDLRFYVLLWLLVAFRLRPSVREPLCLESHRLLSFGAWVWIESILPMLDADYGRPFDWSAIVALAPVLPTSIDPSSVWRLAAVICVFPRRQPS